MTITTTQSISDKTNNTTLTSVLTTVPAVGSLVVVKASFYNNNALTAPTVGGFPCAPSFTPSDTPASGGDFVAQWWVVIPSTAPNGNVVFATSNYYQISATEYASTVGWPANPITASGATPVIATGNSVNPAATISPTAAGSVISTNFSNGGTDAGDNGTAAAPGYTRDYSAINGNGNEGGAGAYKIVTSAGAQTATHTAPNSFPWACAIVAYAENSGGGGSTNNDDSASPTRRLLRGDMPHLRMSPQSAHEARRFLRAQKRVYSFAA
jgi:hypothetical protein